ncbi:Alpha/beta-Hydrolases superfamily protein [Hibiscus syriacus]|uniref:Alpha/beta-Hydrolases superfamily protein n=1 Tax=Hibiscus syriacus TaxID=106335 RepID=A0A6A2ZMI7_HIBSY|nr:probable E3 ubiquitin-protein ligase ATL44 [Hibiscus syriacus]KAE8692940.1 Alpha/beta-Hydrolases superfamily protein [Hibiscus syriacus]
MLDAGRTGFIWCDGMKTRLVKSRACEANRDLETTLMEVKYEVATELAKILSKSIDPAFAGSEGVKIVEEDGGACGICLEDMEKGEEVRALAACGHKFRYCCISMWVKRKQDCPLCRSP